MTRVNRSLVLLCSSLTVLSPGVAIAAPGPQGSVVVRIDDSAGTGRCIGSADRLTATVRRIVVEKKSKWLGLVNDTELGITLTTTVKGATGEDFKSASFAKVIKQAVTQFSAGQISLAQEQNLLSQFPLTNGENKFTVVNFEIGLVRTQGRSVAAQILLGAVSATQSLSLPVNPFTTGFGVASTYVDSIFKPLLDTAEKSQDAVTHNITMNINSGGCSATDDDSERTGTKAIIDASNDVGKPGYIDTRVIDSYCFKAVLRPSFVLKFAPKPASGNCATATGFADLQNSYIGFYVNALPVAAPNPAAGIAPGMFQGAPSNAFSTSLESAFEARGIQKDAAGLFSSGLLSETPPDDVAKAFRLRPEVVEAYRDALTRCEANGVSAKDCIG